MTIDETVELLGIGKLMGYFHHDSAEWHEARKGVAGSLISTIMGHNLWRSAYTAFHEQLELLQREHTGPSMAMKLGTAFERPIQDLWEKENTGWLTVHNTGTWQSKANKAFRANPDAFIEWSDGSIGILEIKFSRNPMTELPPMYRDQVMWYLHVTGLKRGVLVAVAGGDMVEHEILYDEVYAKEMVTKAEAWLDCIKHREVPQWDGSQSTYTTVRALSEGIYEGDKDLGELYPMLMRARDEADKAEEKLTEMKSRVLALLDGIRVGTYEGVKVVTLQARQSGGPFVVFKKGQ